MTKMISMFALASLMMSASVAFAEDAALKADDQVINSACAGDAKTAGCAGEVVGKGLLKCMHAYKKANPTFKFSEECKKSMMQRHSDKASGK